MGQKLGHLLVWLPLIAVALAITGASLAFAKHEDTAGLAGTTLLIVRHAEKPDAAGDPGLSPTGQVRAKAYVDYFRHFSDAGSPVLIDALVATADTPESARPRLTLEPLSHALNLPIQQPFADRDVKDLVRWLGTGPSGRTILIAWHHGKLPKLLADLGADPAKLLSPDGKWPEDTYDWVIVLHYDSTGVLSAARRIVEPRFGPAPHP